MQHALTSPPSSLSDSDARPTFSVVIAYEDFETGKHAKRTYDFLSETLGRECEFTNQMWKFDVLEIPKLREIASGDVAAADLAVVSCHGDDLPKSVRRWIDSWLEKPTKPLALVALFDRVPERSTQQHAVRDYLADIASRGNMEFFAQPDEWPGNSARREDASVACSRSRTGHRALSTLAGVIQRDGSLSARWDPLD